MSKPHNKQITTGTPGQSQTVFIVEGIKTAIIVTARGNRLRRRNARFDSPESALAWCRKHGAGLVYSPSPSALN